MRSRLRTAALLAAGALFAGESLAATLALLPVRRGVEQARLAEAVERELARICAGTTTVVDEERTRSALRRRRLRAPDNGSATVLRDLAGELGADWLVSAALHDAVAAQSPDLTLSARLYDGRTGRLAWAGALGRSGLDGRRLLGLGVVESLDALIAPTLDELLAPLLALVRSGAAAGDAGAEGRERIALVPFTAVGTPEGVEVAMAATETMRAVLAARGAATAEPGCVAGVLRRPEGVRWGELDAPSRRALRDDCGATRLVTGAVERWELVGTSGAPEPIVAVAVRLVDVDSGAISWTGSLERGGSDRPGWFGLGRVFSRGQQLRRLLEQITQRMPVADSDPRAMRESS